MRDDQIQDLIRRNDVRGLVDAGWVLAVARACGVGEPAGERARTDMGYTRAVRTARGGFRWATAQAVD